MLHKRSILVLGALLAAGIAAGSAAALLVGGGSSGSTPSATPIRPAGTSTGWEFHRRVPSIALTTAAGSSLPLSGLRGKVVVLAPSLTLCHEICPMTTQALMLMRRALAARGLGARVALVEATVDPWRDSPARLRTYARLTGAHLIQLTGDLAHVRKLWQFFGIGFRRAPQTNPPDIDWWTGRPETFDVEHTDGVFLIDSAGYERRFFAGPAELGGRLPPALRRLLSATGRQNLLHPQDGWTVAEAMSAVERLLRERSPRGA